MDGDLYAIGTILSPQDKLQFFSTADWDPEEGGIDYRATYRQSLESSLEKYSENLAQGQQILGAPLASTATDEFDLACVRDESQQSQIPQPVQSDELTRYLDSNTVPNAQPRTWWKYHQDEFPRMARLARDVLSIPASGAGVERLFNSARDICHYRRGSLQPQTFSDLMMYMCTSRFEIHEEERIMLSEYLSAQEIQAAKEERTQQQITVDPISDDEEDEGPSTELQATSQPRATSHGLSAKALGKRRLRNIAKDAESDQEDDSKVTSLPEMQH
ncbi:hypothetical protein VTN00DRAFT_9525 [Thermoascus crustaceus]|uniref:uncharacterized protein n=1 Tax=Thermoascus crustaceus TaxID=5088 RepID=UPI003742FF17